MHITKKIVRVLADLNYVEHTAEAFISLKILPFNKLIEFNVLKFMRKYDCGLLPDGFNGEWARNNEIQVSYELRNNDDLVGFRTKNKKVDRLPFFSYISFWNENKYKTGGNFDENVFTPALKSCLLSEHRKENSCNIRDCYSCKITRNRINARLENLLRKLEQNNVISK